MESFGKNTEAAGANGEKYFERDEYDGAADRGQRSHFFMMNGIESRIHDASNVNYTMRRMKALFGRMPARQYSG